MLTEVISEWFKGVTVDQFAILGIILPALAAIRVLTVRFSPTHGDTASEVI